MDQFQALSQALGVPVGGTAVAAGVFFGGTWLEAQIKPEARQDIAAFLKRVHVTAGIDRASALVRYLFVLTFGSKHLSWRCFRRSILATMFFVLTIEFLILSKHGHAITANQGTAASGRALSLPLGILWFFWRSICADYVSLAKTRWLLARMARTARIGLIVAYILLDTILSYVISMAFYWTPLLLIFGSREVCDTLAHYQPTPACSSFAHPTLAVSGIFAISLDMLAIAATHVESFTGSQLAAFVIGISTLLTSVWTVMVLVAIMLLRALLSINLVARLMRWAFDIDEHPIRAIGLVIAALTWTTSVIYALV